MVVQSESLNAMTPLELDASIAQLQRKEKLDELVLMAATGEDAIKGTAEMGADGIRYMVATSLTNREKSLSRPIVVTAFTDVRIFSIFRQKIASVKQSYEMVMSQIVGAKMDKLSQMEDLLAAAEER